METVQELACKAQFLLLCEGCQFGRKVHSCISVCTSVPAGLSGQRTGQQRRPACGRHSAEAENHLDSGGRETSAIVGQCRLFRKQIFNRKFVNLYRSLTLKV